ncbi:MutT motif protein [Deerpox virus W-848-83]|uniref:MutT motif protein n=1 Tax=Deerpox virus (strain Mule deer/United States/W-848-83/1983) TaxID=305674 RepID=Q08FQ7_DPV83|nr:MutT motif [Deerpox virus W-848-83]ABI99250.1 MutT motif protein [Deerpox virus W-848-83]
MSSTIFETSREIVSVEKVDEIPRSKSIHVFAICITSDNKPIIAARRTSFVFQEIMSQRKSPTSTLKVSKNLLRYMYNNEIKEISRRLKKGIILINNINSSFEELILLGGKINKSESVNECLQREIQEESDYHLTIKCFGQELIKISIYDKLFEKKYISYCKICYINETLSTILSFKLYNVEIRELKSLIDCSNNDKYKYLFFIYNTLINSK